MAEKRRLRFRITVDPKHRNRFQIESDPNGHFQPAIAGLEESDVEHKITKLRAHGCEVEDCRPKKEDSPQ